MPARVEAILLIEDLVKQQERETIQKSGLEAESHTESGLKSILKTESNQKSDQKTGLETENHTETIQKSDQKTESNQKSDQKSNQKILEAISKKSVITIKELQELTGLSESGVKKIIRNLRADNQIRRVGPDKGGHWEIVVPSSD